MGLALHPAQTFEELATKTHDINITIANHCGSSFGSVESKKDKVQFKKNVEFSKNSTKEAMSIFKVKLS